MDRPSSTSTVPTGSACPRWFRRTETSGSRASGMGRLFWQVAVLRMILAAVRRAPSMISARVTAVIGLIFGRVDRPEMEDNDLARPDTDPGAIPSALYYTTKDIQTIPWGHKVTMSLQKHVNGDATMLMKDPAHTPK